MRPNVPSTVIKLPIDVTESNSGARIRLRNNIRLNLPPDTFSLLQSRSLCILLLFYLSYSLYLHYILYVHIAAQDVTNRRMSAEIDKLNQRLDAIRISDLGGVEGRDDGQARRHDRLDVRQQHKPQCGPGGAGVRAGARDGREVCIRPAVETGRGESQGSQAEVSILLKGAAPTASIRDGGVIRPWYLDARANGNSNSDVSEHFVLQELNGKVQIMKSGLYMVYAQIYYTSSEHLTNIWESINSYSVTVAATSGTERALAVCSVHASVNLTSEVSCHLSIVYHLNRGEWVYLVQREPNRKILLKDGYSYFGLSTLRLDATRM